MRGLTPNVQQHPKTNTQVPSSSMPGAAMRQSHHPHFSVDARSMHDKDASVYSSYSSGDNKEDSSINAYYDTSVMNATLQSSYHESGVQKGNIHQGEPVVHSLPLSWRGPGTGVRLIDSDTATAAADAAAAADSIPNMQIPVGPPTMNAENLASLTRQQK